MLLVIYTHTRTRALTHTCILTYAKPSDYHTAIHTCNNSPQIYTFAHLQSKHTHTHTHTHTQHHRPWTMCRITDGYRGFWRSVRVSVLFCLVSFVGLCCSRSLISVSPCPHPQPSSHHPLPPPKLPLLVDISRNG